MRERDGEQILQLQSRNLYKEKTKQLLKWKYWHENKLGYHEEVLDNWLMKCDDSLRWKCPIPEAVVHLTLVSLTQNLALNSYLLCFNRKGVE